MDNNQNPNNVSYNIYIGSLIFKKIGEQPLSSKEEEDLNDWLNASDNNALLLEQLQDRPAVIRELRSLNKKYDPSAAIARVFEALQLQKPIPDEHTVNRREWWIHFSAAAAVILLFISTWVYWGRPEKNAGPAVTLHQPQTVISPGTSKAILMLSDGSEVALDSAGDVHVATQGNAKVINQNGRLSYYNKGAEEKLVFNKILTPRGGQYQLTLEDGSKVWLNAASSLRFPTVFSGSVRNVELTGEAYFEIAKDAARPFFVTANNTAVKVLGTSFNVMAYDDEPEGTQTTLVSGRVAVSAFGNT